MAPEVINIKLYDGYSFEVDVWAIGIMTYTMLIGKEPFNSYDTHNIYQKVLNCEYEIEKGKMSSEAQSFIEWILNGDPSKRPELSQILFHPFMNGQANIPEKLDTSLL